jgi:hypothetical protein
MPAPRKTPKTPEQRIADLERELRLRDERIGELKDEIDESRELVREMEEHAQEHDEYLEMFITTFGLTLNDEGKWGNGEFITSYNALVAQYEDLRGRYNKLVRDFNQYAVPPKPVGRPLAASEAQQAQVIKHHKAGKSARWIAEEMMLSDTKPAKRLRLFSSSKAGRKAGAQLIRSTRRPGRTGAAGW